MEKNIQLPLRDPEYMIGGTLFSYRKTLDVFVDRDVPSNKISMTGIWEDNAWTQFFFDSKTRNIYTGGFPDGKRPADVRLVILPSLPYCERLGIHVKTYQEKQADIKNDQEQKQTQNQRKHKKGRSI